MLHCMTAMHILLLGGTNIGCASYRILKVKNIVRNALLQNISKMKIYLCKIKTCAGLHI